MKKGKKLLAVLLGVTMMFGLTACGDSAKGQDKTYTASFDNTLDAEVLEAIPDYQFIADDLSPLISYGMNLDVTLELGKDGTYKLESKYYNQDPNAKEGDAPYSDIRVNATGTYTKEDDKITISAAESATAVYNGGAYITEQGMFLVYSFNEDGSVGEWSSKEVPEVLECVPETVFTVTDNGAIVNWEAAGDAKGNPHAEVAADETTETTEDTAAAATGLVMTSPEWDAVKMTFNADGTFTFEVPEYSITEAGTWTYADEVLTVTKSDGSTTASAMEAGTMKLSYVSVTSDQMVGNFESTDWNTFFK